jgi:hypothetical protein
MSAGARGEIEVPIRLDVIIEYKAVAQEVTYTTRLTAAARSSGGTWGYSLEAL